MFSAKRYCEVFVTTLLLLVGLPQFIAPILKWQTLSGTAYAQSMSPVRLSRRVQYSNANSPENFQDDRLSYSFTVENHNGSAITGTPLYVDGRLENQVMVASAIPPGTYLSGLPIAPAGWQTLYSTDDRQQTGRSNNSTQINWTRYAPNSRSVRRIAFVKAGALEAYEITDGLGFSLSLDDLPTYAPGVRNTVELYANTQGSPSLIATDESFYTEIDGTAIASTNSGKPTAEPIAALEPAPIEPIDLIEPPIEPPTQPQIEPTTQPQIEPVATSAEPVEPVIEPVEDPGPIAQVDPAGGMCTFAPITTKFSVGFDSGVGGTPASPQVGALMPLAQVPGKNLTYLNSVARLDDFSDPGANVVLGHRFYNEKGDRIHGGYLAYDLGNTGDETFNQLSVGAETLGEVWDGRVNAYIPLEGRQQVESDTPGELAFENPLTTVEAEVGARLYTFDNGGEVRAYAGPYYYTEENTLGGRVGVTIEPINGISVGASVQSDGIFDTQVGFSLNYQLGGSNRTRNQTLIDGRDVVALDDTNSNCNRLNRITTPIRRTAPVRVETEVEAVQPTLSASDRTLKENIEYLGETTLGHRLYAFNYIDYSTLPEGRFVGVMAQDLLQQQPEAVFTMQDGTYAVHYEALGLRMATYSEWQQQGMAAVLAR